MNLARQSRNHRFWTAAGSEAPRRFWKQPGARKAVSPLRSATAVQNFVGNEPAARLGILDFLFAGKETTRQHICPP